ncbi:MAG TPA: TonB-dependent receptor [Gemmatimonadales bacterium]
MTRVRLILLALCSAGPLAAQSTGAIAGRVRDSTGAPLPFAHVTVGNGRQGAESDTLGNYRIREVQAGWHRVTARRIGFQSVTRDSVLVQAGQTTIANFVLSSPLQLTPVVIETSTDTLLDPLAPADVQRIGSDEMRRLPVTTVEEAVALSAGAVGESYRGGRVGQQSFILDGLGVKNQLDASTGGLGLRIPPDILTEASLVTNGFSARYGQAISGLINVVTKDGGDRWQGRAAYETDRPLWGAADMGLDRVVVSGDGPLLGGVRVAGALDAEARLDADPVNAPAPTQSLDPRSAVPWILPHDAGERYDGALKLTVPLGGRHALRLFGARSVERRLLFDPSYKYDDALAPARRVTGTLLSGHLQHLASPAARHPLTADLRVGWFDREFIQGTLVTQPVFHFGAFSGDVMNFLGGAVAERQDTVAAQQALPGFTAPEYSVRTPWGVPAFFVGTGSRGSIGWNRFQELRGQLDLVWGLGQDADWYFGGELVRQRVRTFQRVFAYLPVGDSVPPPSAADFRPTSAAAYSEWQLRASDIGFTLGVRVDQFQARSDTGTGLAARSHFTVSPRFAVSTVLSGATVIASFGRFAQAPDYQYLVDAAFDDTLRTGRFRRGNPDLGYETATQFEFSVRARPSPRTNVRTNLYVKRLEGLVASVPLSVSADSSIFGNADFGSVRGAEALFERPIAGGWGARVTYALQSATATATNAFELFRRIRISSIGDTIFPGSVEFPLDFDRRHAVTLVLQGIVTDSVVHKLPVLRPLQGVETALIARYQSGLPYTRTNATGDSLVGLPNSNRLPSSQTIDLLVRRPLRVGWMQGSVYLDVRNLLNRRNVESVRRETGAPGFGPQEIAALADSAYNAHPEAIPYESPRYRAWADLNGDGLIAGTSELLPLYLAAARDFVQPVFFFGPPRLLRLGVELDF